MSKTPSNVFTIAGKPLESGVPDVHGTISFLEELIEQAKRGEIRAIAVAIVTEDDGARTAFVATNRKFTLLGAVSWLHQRLLDYES